MNVNKVIVMGNLTRDPEARAMPSGATVVNLSIATNRFWTDKSGQKQKETEFHNAVLFGRQAEIAKQYLTKGSPIFVEGRLKTRNWQGQDGVKKYRTEVIVLNLQLGPRNFGAGAASNSVNPAPPQENKRNEAENLDVIEYPEEDINLEDIPF